MTRNAFPRDLRRLARLCGIALGYHDIWGEFHPAAEAPVRSALESMGLAASSAEEVARSAANLLRARWESMLRPVITWDEGSPCAVYATVREDEGPLAWRLEQEDGAVHEGRIEPSRFLASRIIDGAHYRRVLLPRLPYLPSGYHILSCTSAARGSRAVIIVAPRGCYLPEGLQGGRRIWGYAMQLYSVVSKRNWGIGDYTDLLQLAELAAETGAGILGVNPLHALSFNDPLQASPYSPQSRSALNPWYLDVEAMDGFHSSPLVAQLLAEDDIRERLEAARGRSDLSYGGVAALKRPFFEALYREFCERELSADSPLAAEYRRFVEEGGRDLRVYAAYEALQRDLGGSWREWSEELRSFDAPAVEQWCSEHEDDLGFFCFLQWQAHRQLRAAGKRCLERRLAVGLYLDLALGASGGSAEVWGDPQLFATSSSGAPPDECNLKGQDWGLPPYIPAQLTARAYAPFIAVLRSAMRYAGALRLDHVMGLRRLFWVPPGFSGENGVYVYYPFADLLRVVVLESNRNNCLIIGEDLGTVPAVVREGMSRTGMFAYKLLMFMKDERGRYLAPHEYPEEAVVMASTHDLATLRGFWEETDLKLRSALSLFPSEELERTQFEQRRRDKAELLAALRREGLLPELGDEARWDDRLYLALHEFIARTPTKLLLVQFEDVLFQERQVNLPGVSEGYPSWRHRLSVAIDSFNDLPAFRSMSDALRRERGG